MSDDKEEFLKRIQSIKVNVPDEYFFLEYNSIIYDVLEENKQLKEAQNELREKIRNKLVKYFDIGNDSYFYILTRDKSAYQYGTMHFDDFKEFDEEQIDDIINFLFSKRSDE